MEQNVSFDLERSIDIWFSNLKVEPTITESDAEELKCHLLDQIDDLKRTGLDDKEAFWVASNRLSLSEELAEDYQQTNNHLIQMKKSILILGGVLVYFLIDNLIEFTSKALFLLILNYIDSTSIALNWLLRYFTFCSFCLVIFITSLFFLENYTISIIERIKFKPKHTIFLLIIAGFFEFLDMFLFSKIKENIAEYLILQDRFIRYNGYFDILFPILVCAGFILIYYKYNKKSKFL